LKWKVKLAQAIGCDRLVAPSAGSGQYTEDDFKRGIDNLREAADIVRPFGVTLMLEFARYSRFAGSLPTALELVRRANNPNVRVMTTRIISGAASASSRTSSCCATASCITCISRTCPPIRRGRSSSSGIAYPSEGIAPLRRIVELLKRKQYAGAASLELFNPAIQSMDPYQVAMRGSPSDRTADCVGGPFQPGTPPRRMCAAEWSAGGSRA
jgi:sugar phosphate isomerase/epimerase